MKRLVYILPALGFVALAVFLFEALRGPPPNALPSTLVGKPVPQMALPALDAHIQGFAPADFRGHVTVLNVFASWCVPCRVEAPAIAAIAGLKDVALYGMVYKDKVANAELFLAQVGTRYDRIGLDADGRGGIAWGIYGVPETFIVDPHGIVRERFAGPITPDALSGDILPAIARAAKD